MKPRTFEEPNGKKTMLLAIINPKFPAAINFSVPACESCMLKGSKNLPTNTEKGQASNRKVGVFVA